MKKNKRKAALTLIEIMIVIFIIGMISSVVGVNMKKSLDKGKHFKTKQALLKLHDIIEIETSNGDRDEWLSNEGEIQTNVKEIINNSYFVRKASDILKDGWGQPFEIVVEEDQLRFISQPYQNYCDKQGITYDYPWESQ